MSAYSKVKMEKLTGEIIVISYPHALEDGQANKIRERALDILGPGVRVLVLGAGGTASRLDFPSERITRGFAE